MDNIGKLKSARSHQAPKPYDRRKSLLGRVSDSVKEMLAPSWLVDLVQSVKKKTPPQSPQSYQHPPDNHRPMSNVFPSSSRMQGSVSNEQVFPGQENGMPQEQSQFNPAMYGMSLGSRDQLQFSQHPVGNREPLQFNPPSLGNRDPHQFSQASMGNRDQYNQTALGSRDSGHMNQAAHYNAPTVNREPTQFNLPHIGGRDTMNFSNQGHYNMPPTNTGSLHEPVQFTSDSLPFGGINKLDISSSMLVNGGDDQSELSEFTGSGCVVDKKDCDKESRRIHEMRQEYGGSVTPSKEIEQRQFQSVTESPSHTLGERSFLWSGEVKPGGHHHSSPQPPAKRYRPSFNLSLFGSSMPSPDKEGTSFYDSSYYPGKTQFGGAASHRKKRQKIGTPIELTPNRKHVQAKPLTPSAGGGSLTSSTARKILDSLERMSTPLRDAKKIPSYNSSIADSPLSFTPGVYRRRSFTGRTSHNSGPPVQGISSPSPASVTKNLQKPVSTASLQRYAMIQAGKTSVAPITGLSDQSYMGGNRDIPEVDSVKQRTGKMKRERSTFHSSKRATEDDDEIAEIPDLPTTFTLPVSNFPKINFGSELSSSNAQSSAPENNSLTRPPLHGSQQMQFGVESSRVVVNGNSSKNVMSLNGSSSEQATSQQSSGEFSFSSPIAKAGPDVNVLETTPKKYTFSSPLTTEQMETEQTTAAPMMQLPTRSTGLVLKKKEVITKVIEEPPSSGGLQPATQLKMGSVMDILKKSSNTTTNVTESKGGFSSAFQPLANSWTCPTCMVNNKENVTKCPCCDTVKPSNSSQQDNKQTKSIDLKSEQTKTINSKPSLGSLFSKPSDKWECPTCMVNNNNDVSKCPCCETAKPGGGMTSTPEVAVKNTQGNDKPSLSTMFKVSSDTWECTTCMIRNNTSLNKCAACESPKPGTTVTSASAVVAAASVDRKPSLSSLFKKPVNNWDCDTCMVSNKPESTKCIACETPKPGVQSTTSFTSPGGFKFGLPDVKSTTTKNNVVPSMTFGVNTSNTSAVINTNVFGTDNKTSTNVTSNLVFGVQKEQTSSLPSNLKFGVGKTDIKPSNADTSDVGGFKIGGDKGQTGALVFGQTSDKQATAGGFKTDDKQTSGFKPSVGGFTFGVTKSSDKVEPPVSATIETTNTETVKTSTPISQAAPTVSLFTQSKDTNVNTGIFGTSFSSTTATKTEQSVFGSTTTSAPSTVGGFAVSTAAPTAGFSTAPVASNGGFSFINKSDSTSANKSVSVEPFSAQKEEKKDNKSSLFSFGQPPAFNNNEKKPEESSGGFTFKPSTETKPLGGGFTFGATTKTTTAPATSGLFSFGTSSSTPTGEKVGVKRDRGSDESVAAKKGKESESNLFGQPSTQGSGAFIFGKANTTTSASSGFGGFSNTTSATTTTSLFSGGTTPAFGSTTVANSAPAFGSSSTVPPFGGPKSTTTGGSEAPAFGNNLGSSTGGSALTFGSTSGSSAFSSTPNFNFGNSSGGMTGPTPTTSSGSSNTSLFQFGSPAPAQTNNNNPGGAFVFGAQSSQPAQTSQTSVFGAQSTPAAQTPGDTGFAFSAQPNMNFGASQPSQSFQFSAGGGGGGAGAANPFSASPAAAKGAPRRPIKRAVRKIRK